MTAPGPALTADEIEHRDGTWYRAGTREPAEGEVIQRHPNGVPAWRGTLRNGRWHGLFTRWYDTGQKQREQEYDNGRPDGRQASWTREGHPQFEYTLVDGRQHGLVTHWYANGNKQSEGHYEHGLPHGVLTNWYENGNRESEISYQHGVREGPWTQWYEEGQVESRGALKDGKKAGIWTRWLRTGEVAKEIDHGGEEPIGSNE